jgi:hypothetical protein
MALQRRQFESHPLRSSNLHGVLKSVHSGVGSNIKRASAGPPTRSDSDTDDNMQRARSFIQPIPTAGRSLNKAAASWGQIRTRN